MKKKNKPIHRQVTFSRTFPATHPRKGQPTYFVEKIYNSLLLTPYFTLSFDFPFMEDIKDFLFKNNNIFQSLKFHTIRKGKRFKEGDFIVPMVWAGKPYHKTTDGKWKIQFAPSLKLVKVYDFEIKEGSNIYINNVLFPSCLMWYLVSNDGLGLEDFEAWFYMHKGHNFSGQILCWEDPNY